MEFKRIITVGVSPAWDVKCQCGSLGWNEHVNIENKIKTPAGKALNVSKALAWMKVPSVAMGLWGSEDHDQMADMIKSGSEYIKLKMTKVEGKTRENIWIVDKSKGREIHLRDKNYFVTKANVDKLGNDLVKTVGKGDVVVFSGSMPSWAVEIVNRLDIEGVRVVIDTSGEALKKVAKLKNIFAVKPNIDELSQLAGVKVKNTNKDIIRNAQKLIDRIDNVIVTRGRAGAIVVSKAGIYEGKFVGDGFETIGTVGCGDYFMGGFLAGFSAGGSYENAMKNAIICGGGRAFGMDEKLFSNAKKKLKVECKNIYNT